MKTLFTTLLLVALPCAVHGAGIATTAFQASLTVTDACRVDTVARMPVVSCQLASPSQVAPRAQQAAFDAVHDGPLWVVTF